MKEKTDVIVVGGGPCGSFTALKLAKLGVDVTVFEEHAEIGIPSHCPGHLSIKGLRRLDLYPLPAGIVENTFHGANFHSPSGNILSVHFSAPVTCTVDRALFDKYIAKKAQLAGADYYLNSRVESVVFENGFARGVNIKEEARVEKACAKIIVDDEGVSSRLLKQAGMSGPDRNRLVKGVETEVEDVEDVEPDMVEVFLGSQYSPGFYAWLIPKRDKSAKLGLAARTGNPRELLQKLMHKHPTASKKLHTAKIIHTAFHPIALGGPTLQDHTNGFLAVGDAASQVKPTTGGGLIFGMTCAQIAAEVADKALQKNDVSKEFLDIYHNRCQETLGFDTKVMLRIRRILDGLSDKKIDHMINMYNKLNMDKSLQKVDDLDFQGQTLLHVLRSPRILAALTYFFFLHHLVNP